MRYVSVVNMMHLHDDTTGGPSPRWPFNTLSLLYFELQRRIHMPFPLVGNVASYIKSSFGREFRTCRYLVGGPVISEAFLRVPVDVIHSICKEG